MYVELAEQLRALLISTDRRLVSSTNSAAQHFNLHDRVIRPSYGMAEATVHIATRRPGQPPEIVHFESEKLSAGQAKRCSSQSGTPLVSDGVPQCQTIRIVDPETSVECPAGTVGEIWVHGGNVASGYWQKPDETERTFRGRLVATSGGTPDEPWRRTGDLGFFSDGELFIIGRIKDPLIVYGRNHSPDDIEATVQEITRGRCAAIAVPNDGTEQLVVIIEFKKRGESERDVMEELDAVKGEVTSAISTSHGSERCGPCSCTTWFDSHHHQRQGQTSGVRRAVPARSVRPLGRLSITNS
jgi:fatty acid CoA ligase FadD28